MAPYLGFPSPWQWVCVILLAQQPQPMQNLASFWDPRVETSAASSPHHRVLGGRCCPAGVVITLSGAWQCPREGWTNPLLRVVCGAQWSIHMFMQASEKRCPEYLLGEKHTNKLKPHVGRKTLFRGLGGERREKHLLYLKQTSMAAMVAPGPMPPVPVSFLNHLPSITRVIFFFFFLSTF